MTANEKARKLCVPLYAEIHRDLGGIITMGDIASIIGNRMNDVCMDMHQWTLEQAQELHQGAMEAAKEGLI
jgi:hypothetical protein